MICDKCKEQMMVLVILRMTICGCGTKVASKELIDYIKERNG